MSVPQAQLNGGWADLENLPSFCVSDIDLEIESAVGNALVLIIIGAMLGMYKHNPSVAVDCIGTLYRLESNADSKSVAEVRKP